MKAAIDIMRDDSIRADVSEPVSKLIGRFIENDSFEACIFDGKHFAGVFSYYMLLKSRVDIKNLKVSRVCMNVPRLKAEHDLVDISALMFDSGSIILPVVKRKFLGAVHVFDIFRNVREVAELKGLKVKDIRHPSAITINREDKLNKALEMMRYHHIDRLPVADKKGDVSDFLSYVDILKKYYSHHLKRDVSLMPHADTKAFTPNPPRISNLPVLDFIERRDRLITISENQNVAYAAEQMVKNGVMSLMIEGRKSIVTKRDILEAIMQTRLVPVNNIRFIGLNEIGIDGFTRAWVEKISSYHSEKLRYLVKNRFDVVVHIKEYDSAGKARKYSVHINVNFPGRPAFSCSSHDWSLRRGLHKAFEDVYNKLQHRYKWNVRERLTPRKGEI